MELDAMVLVLKSDRVFCVYGSAYRNRSGQGAHVQTAAPPATISRGPLVDRGLPVKCRRLTKPEIHFYGNGVFRPRFFDSGFTAFRRRIGAWESMRSMLLAVSLCLSLSGGFAEAGDLTPLVVGGEVPTYPPLANQARISGRVVVKVKIANGSVVDAHVRASDNPLLVQSTVQNIRSWRFEKSANAEVETEFVYELRKTEAEMPENPVIELRLPTRVHLIAAPVRPTVNY
ncbi:MAG: energy transducer TonB [Acidobacteriota bacterium]